MKSLAKLATVAAALPALSWTAMAQTAPAPAESGGEPISILMFFTLIATFLIVAGSFVWFLRKRSNREATKRGLGIGE